jgi:ABC-type uncharacterized transport system ATPase component
MARAAGIPAPMPTLAPVEKPLDEGGGRGVLVGVVDGDVEDFGGSLEVDGAVVELLADDVATELVARVVDDSRAS